MVRFCLLSHGKICPWDLDYFCLLEMCAAGDIGLTEIRHTLPLLPRRGASFLESGCLEVDGFQADGGVEGHPPQATGEAESADVRQTAGIEPGPSEAIPASTGGPQETPASAPPKNPDAGVLEATDCIHEIFHWVRKLMRGHQGFVLDEPAFMAELEEVPLFVRDGDHLRRWTA